MNDFTDFFKRFKGIFVFFLAVICAILIPVKIGERKYLELLLVLGIAAFLVLILFGLSRFFCSMAVGFYADEESAYFSYTDKNIITVSHSQIQTIQSTYYRYIFVLDNGKKINLLRIAGIFRTEKNFSEIIKQTYSEKLI